MSIQDMMRFQLNAYLDGIAVRSTDVFRLSPPHIRIIPLWDNCD